MDGQVTARTLVCAIPKAVIVSWVNKRLEEVGKAGDGQQVGDLGRQAGAGIRVSLVIDLGLLGGLHREEGRIICPFAMAQRDEALIGQFFFPAVRNGDFGGALQRHVAIVSLKGVGRQAFHQAAAFDAADGGAPTVLRKRTSEARA